MIHVVIRNCLILGLMGMGIVANGADDGNTPTEGTAPCDSANVSAGSWNQDRQAAINLANDLTAPENAAATGTPPPSTK